MANTKKTSTSKTKTKTESKTSTKGKKLATKAAGEETESAADASSTSTPKPKKPAAPAVKRSPLLPRTHFARTGEHSERWQLYDAANQPLGRLSSIIATALMGKDRPTYTRHADAGAHVVVINAEKVALTGNKWNDKTYHYHTNYPGGLKSFTARELLEKHPERIIERAVYGMLPKGHMGRRWFKKLRVFVGTEHPHTAQQPELVNLPNLSTREKA